MPICPLRLFIRPSRWPAGGDGGAVFTNSSEENELVKSCRVHGMSPEDHYDNVRLGMTGPYEHFPGCRFAAELKVFDQELKDRARGCFPS